MVANQELTEGKNERPNLVYEIVNPHTGARVVIIGYTRMEILSESTLRGACEGQQECGGVRTEICVILDLNELP